jgi:membrane protease YdiL (CAAX protease family)
MPPDTPEPELTPDIAPELGAPDSLPPDTVPELFRQEPPIPRRPWGFWAFVLFVVFSLFALAVSSLLTFAAYHVLRPFFGWHLAPDNLRTNAFFNIAFQSILYAILFCYLYILVVMYYRLPFWSGLGWRRMPPRRVLQFVLLGAALSLGIEFAPTLLPDKNKFPLVQLFSSPAAAYALALFAILIAPPIEELLFRGVLFAFFERLGIRFAVAATALLFAGLHLQEYQGAWNHALLILIVGLVFSLARALTGSLAPSIVLHMSYNATQMVVLFLASDHFRSIPGSG